MRKGKGRNSGLLPNSFKIISSCLKTVSTNASTVVRSAGATVSASISASSDDRKDQVIWAGFDKLQLGPAAFKCVLLIGYQNGFQVIDIEETSNFNELVSKHDGPVTFLQMLPVPTKCDGNEGYRSSHPLMLVVAGDEANRSSQGQTCNSGGSGRDGGLESQSGNSVRFYSLRSNCYVQVLRFRSAVFMVRCSPLIVAVGLETQIYCIDAVTLQNKFSLLTYPVPQFGGQVTVNVGYGPMAVGHRWLAYASDNPLLSNTSRLSPKNLISPGISPSTSPSNGSLMARYAMESSKHLATGIINLGDMGYKTFSRYCHELLPDGSSSPVLSNSSWKVRVGGSETENAGMVVVKDVVSGVIISQFRAHTSPISALCFDPSGTLLVTASIHGNNINIFRIIPACIRRGSNNQSCDWSSSHVHLYKLHRGLTSAIIQDIAFSHYSQWIAIVSSKGTCHIYVLSPFGGDPGFQTHDSRGECSAPFPVVSLPWWFTSSFIINRQSSSPPPPVTLSVVSRIKDNNSGLLSSVSNVAASAVGKVSVPSGAVAAVFHNSMPLGLEDASTKRNCNSLEHLLVYNPSGYVVQHELVPSVGFEPSDFGLKTQSPSYLHMQDEELRIKVEPVQWWDVCRRSDCPEREESISGTASDIRKTAEVIGYCKTNESVGGKKLLKGNSLKPPERSHLFISNAEVQISSGRFPIWQNSKIHLYMMSPPRLEGYGDGESEIEKVPSHEVEIKRKDLLPVFDHFHSIKSGWNDRGNSSGRSPNLSSLEPRQARDKVADETVFCHSNPASLSSTESSDGGSSRRTENLIDLDPMNNGKSSIPTNDMLSYIYQESRGTINQKSVGTPASNAGGISTVPLLNADHIDSAIDVVEVEVPPPSSEINAVDFGQFFQEGYCKVLERDGCRKLTDDVNNGDSHYEREKSDEYDGEEDELLGGMFDFSEEG
ncbi:hypothetical protein LguiA_020353 [Lonicera macranthoides]